MAGHVKHRKVTLMGFRSVGKSSLAIQFVQGHFTDGYDPTIENTFNKVMRVKNQEFEIFIVDTAGQDEYSVFPSQYTVDTHGYVIVYSIDSAKSFEVARSLYDKIVDMSGNRNVPVILVGNKSDLQDSREVSRAEGEQLAKSMNAVFLETSARDNPCVTDLFQRTVLQIEKANEAGGGEEKKCVIS